jgi:hypothetical protein
LKNIIYRPGVCEFSPGLTLVYVWLVVQEKEKKRPPMKKAKEEREEEEYDPEVGFLSMDKSRVADPYSIDTDPDPAF